MSADVHDHGPSNPYVAHHFVDMEQQHEAAKLGVWLFLLTEILLFGGLFCFYALYRFMHPEMFVNMNQLLDVKMGAINTIVLITSSVTVALAIRETQLNNRSKATMYLVLTILFAGVFLVIKYFEYTHKIHLGLLPGQYFNPQFAEMYNETADKEQAMSNIMAIVNSHNPHAFLSVYFCMTGLHGLHVVFGMIYLAWVTLKNMKGAYSSQNYAAIEMGGLYWHLVDLIWIFLFPLLYLIG